MMNNLVHVGVLLASVIVASSACADSQQDPSIEPDLCTREGSAPWGLGAEPPYSALSVEGVMLRMMFAYDGGCGEHRFVACWDGEFVENAGVVTASLTPGHDDGGDNCEASFVSATTIDLTDLALAWHAYAGADDMRPLRLRVTDRPPRSERTSESIDWVVPEDVAVPDGSTTD